MQFKKYKQTLICLLVYILCTIVSSASGYDEFSLYWKMDETSGTGDEFVQLAASETSTKTTESYDSELPTRVVSVNTAESSYPEPVAQLALNKTDSSDAKPADTETSSNTPGTSDYKRLINYFSDPGSPMESLRKTGDSRAKNNTRTRENDKDSVALSLRGLHNVNTVYSGDADYNVGAYLRAGATYCHEVLCYDAMSSIANTDYTVDSAVFWFNITNIHNGGSYDDLPGELFEQDKGNYSSTASFDTYAISAWSKSLGTKTLAYDASTGWYRISSSALNDLVQDWADSPPTSDNQGLILGGHPQYWDYWWDISHASLVVYYQGGDTENPYVLVYTPSDDAGSVSSSANLVLAFNEDVDAESGAPNDIVIYNYGGSEFERIDAQDSKVTGSGDSIITIDPEGTFSTSGACYYVKIEANAFNDAANNSYAGIADETTWNFKSADTENPAVSTYNPLDNASDVSLTADLVLTFNDVVDAESGNIKLYKTTGDVLIESFNVTTDISGSGSTQITADPASSLLYSTDYYVQIDNTTFDDTTGNSYAGIADKTTWNFTTLADTEDPYVTVYSPLDNASAVAEDADLVLTFNENVTAVSGYIKLYKTTGDVLVQQFNVTSDISGSGTTTITANPSSNFESEIDYYVQIDATAFDDAYSNSYAGIADKTTWNFTSEDNEDPYVSTYSPLDNATGVGINDNLVLTFNENVTAMSGYIKLYKTTGDVLIQQFDVTTDISGSGTSEITANPTSSLLYSTDYYVKIDATAFDDASSNNYAGIADETTWNFTTLADTEDPYVTVYSPLDDASGVSLTADLVLTFNENVDAESGDIHLYKTTGDVLVQSFDVTSDITGDGTTTITADPTSSLLASTDYYVKIDATAFDDAYSNNYAGIADKTTWNFSTSVNVHGPVAGSGNALQFDGVEECVDLPSGCMASGDFTLEFWCKPNSPVNGRIFIQGPDDCATKCFMAEWYDGLLQVCDSTEYSDNNSEAACLPTNGVWSHVAWTVSGTDHTVYLNGEESSTSPTGTWRTLEGGNYIACRNGNEYFWKGDLDEVRLWNDVRTQTQIQDNMYTALEGDESNLVGYWRMDTTAGTNVEDYSSGTDYDGTFINMLDANWVASEAWKERTTAHNTPLTHCAGWEPDDDEVSLSEITAPASGNLSFNNSMKTVTYAPGDSIGTLTYEYAMSDGYLLDTFAMSVDVTNLHKPIAGSGNALVFDGGEYVSLGTSSMISGTAWSLEFWIKTNSPDDNDRIFIQGSAAEPELMAVWDAGNGQVEFVTSTGGAGGTPEKATTAITDATWTHVAWTYTSGTSNVYVNGEISEGTASSTDYSVVGNNYIACRNGDQNYFTGTLDEIRLWSDVRTQAEIQNNMYEDLAGSESNLVGYWRMDTTAGDHLEDYSSGTDYDGTLTDMEPADWIASDAWKNRTTSDQTDLTHSAGWEPDGDEITLTELTAPSQGSISFNNFNETVTYTPTSGQPGDFTYEFVMDDGSLKDTFEISVTVTATDNYDDWSYNKKLFINTTSTGAAVDGDVLDFPLLVRLDSDNFTFSEALSTGFDMRFSKSDGTHLSYEMERWDNSGELAEFWVLCDTVQGDNETQYIKMHWGKAGAGDSSSAANVFDTSNDFSGVWHLNGTDYTDATSNANNASNYQSVNATGNIADGQSFDGSNDYLNAGSKSSIDNMDVLTASAWINPTGWGEGDWGRICDKHGGALLFLVTNDGTYGTEALRFKRHRTTTTETEGISANNTLDLSEWAYVTAVMNSTTSIKLYIDGTEVSYHTQTAGSGGLESDASGDLYIGRNLAGDRAFYGIIDELRLSKTTRSSDWIKLCYETQKSGSNIVIHDDRLLPLTITYDVGTDESDTCAVSTDLWKIVFDEDNGGGIKWLSDESGTPPGTNQLSNNLFYIVQGGSNSYDATDAVLTMLDSCKLFCNLKQSFTINSFPWEVEYTVYGSGRMFVRAETAALTADNDPSGGIEFRVESNVTNDAYYKENTSAAASNYVLHADSATGQFDILLALKEDWADATGFSAATGDYYGYVENDWILTTGNKQSWDFMIDFAHKQWKDTSGVGKHADEYRGPDSLEFLQGNIRMEKAWEHGLIGHWTLDDSVVTGGTIYDYSGSSNNYDGTLTIAGADGEWTDEGKWNGAFDFETASGNDYFTVTNDADYNCVVFTIMMWIKPETQIGTGSVLYGKWASSQGIKLAGDGSGNLALVLNGTTYSGSSGPGTGSWKHVAATYNYHDWGLRLYINGALVKCQVGQYPISSNNEDVVIGSGFDGVIDDVRFYNTVISEETIKAIYQNGYRSNAGMYMLRATNNNTVHFKIDGTTAIPHYFPAFQIANYWATAKPDAVYYNGSQLTEDTHYYSKLDDNANLLYIGFDRVVRSSDVRIYIDDTDHDGATMVNPMDTLTRGVPSRGGYYVKNTSSASFGAAGSNEFYLEWDVGSGAAMDGELSVFKSSEESGSANTAISSCDNMLPTTKSYGTFGFYDPWISNYYTSSCEDVSTTPAYTILEESGTRVRLKIDERVVDQSSGPDYDINTIWTIYPTGQIFRYDTLDDLSTNFQTSNIRFRTLWEADLFLHYTDKEWRAGIRGGSTTPDHAIAFLSSGDIDGERDLFTGGTNTGNDTIEHQYSEDNYMGYRFHAADDWTTSKDPFMTAFYIDIQHWNMSDDYIDSVCDAVQNIKDLTINNNLGTRITTSEGDIDGDGFNEGEGAYIIQATNNSVDFTILADGSDASEGCRFYPVFRITSYTASHKPKYVYLYGSSSETKLLRGYGYNCYQNKVDDYIVIQLNAILCQDTSIYISSDNDLAVTMSDFYANPGDGNDTLFWRTESEQDNLGFYLYRRIFPDFMDSLSKAVDSTTADSVLDNAGRMLRRKEIGFTDTTWVSITKDIIPSQVVGNSPEPLDYMKIDWDVENHIVYEYKLEAVAVDKTRDVYGPITVKPIPILPRRFFLFHNFPNPVRRYTIIRFDLPKKTKVSLYIYNLQGRLIKRIIRPDRKLNPGFYKVKWRCDDEHGRLVASGPYIYRLVASKYVKSRLMILVK